MSETRSTDMGTYVLVETGEPTLSNPSVSYSRDMQWKAGTPPANAQTLQQRAQAALSGNATYLALANPTTVQNTAQIKALTRQINGLIRLLVTGDTSTIGDS